MNLLDPLGTGILDRHHSPRRARVAAPFDAFCHRHDVTPAERRKLIAHLVTLRVERLLDRLDPPSNPGATP